MSTCTFFCFTWCSVVFIFMVLVFAESFVLEAYRVHFSQHSCLSSYQCPFFFQIRQFVRFFRSFLFSCCELLVPVRLSWAFKTFTLETGNTAFCILNCSGVFHSVTDTCLVLWRCCSSRKSIIYTISISACRRVWLRSASTIFWLLKSRSGTILWTSVVYCFLLDSLGSYHCGIIPL